MENKKRIANCPHTLLVFGPSFHFINSATMKLLFTLSSLYRSHRSCRIWKNCKSRQLFKFNIISFRLQNSLLLKIKSYCLCSTASIKAYDFLTMLKSNICKMFNMFLTKLSANWLSFKTLSTAFSTSFAIIRLCG